MKFNEGKRTTTAAKLRQSREKNNNREKSLYFIFLLLISTLTLDECNSFHLDETSTLCVCIFFFSGFLVSAIEITDDAVDKI